MPPCLHAPTAVVSCSGMNKNCWGFTGLMALGAGRGACRREHRRMLVLAVAVAVVVLAMPQAAQAQPRYTVSAEQLQQSVAQRFPIRYGVPGLVDLDIEPPQLHLLQQHNRMRAQMAVAASGPALDRAQRGTFDVEFALRYEPADRTIRAHQLQFRNLQLPGLTPQASDLLNVYGPAMAAQALQEVVLHRLRPQDLAMADSLGMRPDSITVTDQGLVIGFVFKPL